MRRALILAITLILSGCAARHTTGRDLTNVVIFNEHHRSTK